MSKRSPYVSRVLRSCELVSIQNDHLIVDHHHEGRLTVFHDPAYPVQRWSDWLERIRECCRDWLLVDLLCFIYAYLASDMEYPQQKLTKVFQCSTPMWTWHIHTTKYCLHYQNSIILSRHIQEKEPLTLLVIKPLTWHSYMQVFYDPVQHHVVIVQGREESRILIYLTYQNKTYLS